MISASAPPRRASRATPTVLVFPLLPVGGRVPVVGGGTTVVAWPVVGDTPVVVVSPDVVVVVPAAVVVVAAAADVVGAIDVVVAAAVVVDAIEVDVVERRCRGRRRRRRGGRRHGGRRRRRRRRRRSPWCTFAVNVALVSASFIAVTSTGNTVRRGLDSVRAGGVSCTIREIRPVDYAGLRKAQREDAAREQARREQASQTGSG